MTKQALGEYIKERRTELGISQKELADELSVTFQTVSKWENGKCYPDIELFPNLAMVLQTTEQQLFDASKKPISSRNVAKMILIGVEGIAALALVVILSIVAIGQNKKNTDYNLPAESQESENSETSEKIDVTDIYNGPYAKVIAKDTADTSYGYYFTDLNEDGIEELIIGQYPNEEDNFFIHRVYTLEENMPVLVIDAWMRNRYYIMNDNVICNVGSGGAGYYVRFYYKLEGHELKPIEGVVYDFEEGVDEPYYYFDAEACSQFDEQSGTAERIGKHITEEQAGEIISKYIEIQLMFSPYKAE